MLNKEPQLNMTMCPAHIKKSMSATVIYAGDDYYFYCIWKDRTGQTQYTRVFNNHPRAAASKLRRCER